MGGNVDTVCIYGAVDGDASEGCAGPEGSDRVQGRQQQGRASASFSLAVGDRVEVTEDANGVHIRRKPRKSDLTGIYGSCPGLKPLTPEEREFEERELPWHLLGIRLD